MGSQRVVAKRYARALIDIAAEKNIYDPLSKDLNRLLASLNDNPRWIEIMGNRNIADSTKKRLINELKANTGLSIYLVSLIKILTEQKRLFLLSEIKEFYDLYKLRIENGVVIEVTISTKDVIDSIDKELKLLLGEITGKKPRIKYHEDPAVIGGIIIKMGDTILDGSIRGELTRFKSNLMSSIFHLREGIDGH